MRDLRQQRQTHLGLLEDIKNGRAVPILAPWRGQE